jgi:hypothetical protein
MHEPTHETPKSGLASDEGNLFTIGLGVLATFVFGPALGFYMGTVCVSPHVVDLQEKDILNGGLPGAGIGFLVGLCGLIYILAVYPKKTAKDARDYDEEFSHPHFGKHH